MHGKELRIDHNRFDFSQAQVRTMQELTSNHGLSEPDHPLQVGPRSNWDISANSTFIKSYAIRPTPTSRSEVVDTTLTTARINFRRCELQVLHPVDPL